LPPINDVANTTANTNQRPAFTAITIIIISS
jgi:hypothetical protein